MPVPHTYRMGVWIAALSIAVGLSVAAADSIDALIAEFTKGQTELGEAEKRAEELAEEHQRDEQAYLGHTEKQNQLGTQIESIKSNFEESARRQLDHANQIIENWNDQCAVDRVGELDEAAYNRCASLRTGVENEAERIRSSVDQQIEIVQQTQIDPLIDLIQREQQAINEIAIRSQQRQAEFERLQAAANRIVARLEQIQSQLGSDCANAPSDEMASFCASLGFDRAAGAFGQSADPVLQPAPFSATPNR